MTRRNLLQETLMLLADGPKSCRAIAAALGTTNIPSVHEKLRRWKAQGHIQSGPEIPGEGRSGPRVVASFCLPGQKPLIERESLLMRRSIVAAPQSDTGIVPAALQARTALEQAWGGRDA